MEEKKKKTTHRKRDQLLGKLLGLQCSINPKKRLELCGNRPVIGGESTK